MANSFEELIFSRDPESQNVHGRRRKCYQVFGISLLAFCIFIIPYAIIKIEISSLKYEIKEEITELKAKQLDFNRFDSLQKNVSQLESDVMLNKIDEEIVIKLRNQIEELKDQNSTSTTPNPGFSKKISDLENQVEELKKQSSTKTISDAQFSQTKIDLENQIEELRNQSSAFFKYKIVHGTQSAFYKFEEKMNFKV